MRRSNLPTLSLPAALPLILAGFLAGCGSDPVVLSADLAPLEAVNKAPLPEANEGHDFPEEVRTATHELYDKEAGEDVDAAHARGYIHAPLAAVLRALIEPDTSVDRRQVAEWSVKHHEETEHLAAWRLHSVVHNVITVNFDTEWRVGIFEELEEEVLSYAARGDKVEGTGFISRLQDSVLLSRVDEHITLVELIRHSITINTGVKENERFILDFYESLRERAHERNLPVWK